MPLRRRSTRFASFPSSRWYTGSESAPISSTWIECHGWPWGQHQVARQRDPAEAQRDSGQEGPRIHRSCLSPSGPAERSYALFKRRPKWEGMSTTGNVVRGMGAASRDASSRLRIGCTKSDGAIPRRSIVRHAWETQVVSATEVTKLALPVSVWRAGSDGGGWGSGSGPVDATGVEEDAQPVVGE